MAKYIDMEARVNVTLEAEVKEKSAEKEKKEEK